MQIIPYGMKHNSSAYRAKGCVVAGRRAVNICRIGDCAWLMVQRPST